VLESTNWGRRFDFDTVLAVRLTWSGLTCLNVSVPVFYPQRSEGGVSHFRYLRDNLLLVAAHARLLVECPFQALRSFQTNRTLLAKQSMKEVTIFTDGGCLGNPGPGGWAAILRYGKHERAISGGEPATTNNRMELIAAISAMQTLKEPCEVVMHTDSQYLRMGITEWIHSWRKRGWDDFETRASQKRRSLVPA
jgi:hypothetical protein